jgi:hypothetical protein
MQIRTGNNIFNKYGCPSRPLSPASLSCSPKGMPPAGNELGGIENQTAEPWQPERDPHLQQPRQQQPQSSASPPPFPPELIDHIVDHLHDDKQSLVQCSMTSGAFSRAAGYHLFRTVSVPSVRRCVQFQELIRSSSHPISSTSSSPLPPPPPPSTSSASTPPLTPLTVHAHASACDISRAGWDISKFVRKIEFHRLDLQSPIEEYVSEAVKLVMMLPRIRDIVFGWWGQTNGLEKIGQAFATAGHNNHPSNLPLSSVSANSETRIEQTHPGGPLRLHLELVDFASVPAFLDVLGAFGGRLKELSLTSVTFGSGQRKDDVEGRCLPGLESVCLGYDGG